MATALTPQTDVTSGEAYRRKKSIKNPIKQFYFIFYFIKSETSDSFVNHFDGHFAYLKTLDFYFKVRKRYETSRRFSVKSLFCNSLPRFREYLYADKKQQFPFCLH